MAGKKTHISLVPDKRASTIANELGTRSRYGNVDDYNVACLGAAFHLVELGHGEATYCGQYSSGETFWFLPGNEESVKVSYAQAKAALDREGVQL